MSWATKPTIDLEHAELKIDAHNDEIMKSINGNEPGKHLVSLHACGLLVQCISPHALNYTIRTTTRFGEVMTDGTSASVAAQESESLLLIC